MSSYTTRAAKHLGKKGGMATARKKRKGKKRKR